MAAARRRIALLLLLALVLAGLAPAPALARPLDQPNPQTAPCYAAAMAALTRQGAIYSQGGHLAGDPIDPTTGTYYPRTGPNSFDCSGLVWWSYAQAGVTIGTTTYQQLNNGVQINCSLADLHGAATTCWTLGDLVFLRYTGGQHVAIYVGAGLFMDCYNYSTGCILHDVTSDPFYAAHFYQARRIVSGCEGMTHNPGTPTTPGSGSDPDLELIPDLLGPVAFSVPQCGDCSGNSANLPLQEQEPPPFDFNPLYPFVWLATMIQNLFVKLICWLLTVVQFLVNIGTSIVNIFIYGINAFWRLLVFIWLSVRDWLYGLWGMLEEFRSVLNRLYYVAQFIAAWIHALYPILLSLLALVGQTAVFTLHIVSILISVLGWIGGLGLSLIGEIIIALHGVSIPAQLVGDNHIVYRMVRGSLDALHDSWLGWLFYLMYALVYIGFVVWLARFLPQSKDT